MASDIKAYNKITVGFVVQRFVKHNDGKFHCVEHSFVAGDEVTREIEEGEDITNELDLTAEVYEPFEMANPRK
jgi:hypothetical protein